jgi:hypothetical protein
MSSKLLAGAGVAQLKADGAADLAAFGSGVSSKAFRAVLTCSWFQEISFCRNFHGQYFNPSRLWIPRSKNLAFYGILVLMYTKKKMNPCLYKTFPSESE